MNILSIFVLIPFLLTAAIIIIRDLKLIRNLSVAGTCLLAILSIILFFLYVSGSGQGNSDEFMFTREYILFRSLNIYHSTGVDGISVLMITMTSLIAFTALLFKRGSFNREKEFYVYYFIIIAGANGFLVSTDVFSMFVFSAMTMIPVYFLMSVWGGDAGRSAGLKHLIIMAGGYALLLTGILGIYMNSGPEGNENTFRITEIREYLIPIQAQRVFFPMVFIGFGIIGALFPFSIRIPGALSSAPAPVSMLFTGVIMKLGAYGALRTGIMLMPEGASELSWVFLIIASLTVIYGAAGTFFQKNLDSFLSYTSISFSGLILFASLLLNGRALNGAVVLILTHGLLGSLLYALSDILKKQYNKQIINELTGLAKAVLLLPLCFIIAVYGLSGLPGLSGFTALKDIITGAFEATGQTERLLTYFTFGAFAIMLLSMLRTLIRLLKGAAMIPVAGKTGMLSPGEIIAASLLIIPVLLMGIFPTLFSSMTEPGFSLLLERIMTVNL